ncbi:MAG: Nif3-like dinuclear metal center hexameric protein [Sedimentisphaerales bacterium]|nr:Nif3-like dinuclear metal center hexameric protein [Sedimentisphaerales bacterium]
MKINDIQKTVERMFPPDLAQGWDNTGLLIGNANQQVKNILLTIDITSEVLNEAKRLKTDLIISYHPIIWDGLKKIVAEPAVKPQAKYLAPRSTRGIVYELIRSGISVYSLHTSLDVVQGGVNDGLAEMVGIKDAKPIGDYVQNPAADSYKLVVFIPVRAVNKVTKAIFDAGAGRLGNYSNCGFQTSGIGSFLPRDGANPAIGKKGKLETVEEMRFECIVPASRLNAVLAALIKMHPYEEPAFDVFKLHNPQTPVGLGRIGNLAKPKPLKEIIANIKRQTGAKVMGIVPTCRENRKVKKAAVCAGSCGKIINLVIAQKCDLYLTGELKHHQALAAQEAGLTCICLSHSVSERFILKKLARQLQKSLKQVKITISKKDKDPFTWKQI